MLLPMLLLVTTLELTLFVCWQPGKNLSGSFNCDCGRSFDSSQKLGGHRKHCLKHRPPHLGGAEPPTRKAASWEELGRNTGRGAGQGHGAADPLSPANAQVACTDGCGALLKNEKSEQSHRR